MDPLSITASVAGIVSLGFQVATPLFGFYSKCKDRNQEVARVLKSLTQLQRMLETTKKHVEQRQFDQSQDHQRVEIAQLVEDCREIIEELQVEYGRFGQKRFKVAYPLRKTTLERVKEDADDIVQHLFRALDILQIQDSEGTRQSIIDVHELLSVVRAGQISTSIRDWLKAPDATVNFNEAIKKRHPNTGLWLVDGRVFSSWLSKGGSFIWLYGFAGSGKSVLSSTIIERIHAITKPSGLRTGVAFFYFSFREETKQDSSALLRALILQLSAQLEDNTLLSQFHDTHRNRSPSNQLLLELLEKIVAELDRTYIVLDALDEVPRDSDRREEVLRIVSAMRHWRIAHLSLLVTSRDELDIRSSLFPDVEMLPGKAISLKDEGVKNDIHSYISGLLKDPKLERFNNYRENILETVSSRASGVFRLAECHLLSLKKCPKSKTRLKRALESLPESLDETYERILLQIVQEGFAEEARRLLILLCVARRPLTVEEVLDGMAVELGDKPWFDMDARLEDRNDLHLICPGLVEIDQQSRLQIAHSSVKEYLLCSRIGQSKVADFYMSPGYSNGVMASICLALLEQELHELPLYTYAERNWAIHACSADPKPEVVSTVLSKLRDMRSICFGVMVVFKHYDDHSDSVSEASVCWLVEQGVPVNIRNRQWKTPLHYAVLRSWKACVQALLAHGAQTLVDKDNMTPFHLSVLVRSPEIARAFLQVGIPIDLSIRRTGSKKAKYADQHREGSGSWDWKFQHTPPSANQPGEMTAKGLTALHFAVLTGNTTMTRFLLENGADPNFASEYGESALHVALKGEVGSEWEFGIEVDDIDSELYSPSDPWCRESVYNRIDSTINDLLEDADELERSIQVNQLRKNQKEVVKIILDHASTDINARDIEGKSPLHEAIKIEDEGLFLALLNKGASVFECDNHGLNGFHYAARSGSIHMIHLVVQSIHDPCESMKLTRSTDNQGRNALHHVLHEGIFSIRTLQAPAYLLRHTGVEVNHLDNKGISPLAKFLGWDLLVSPRPEILGTLFDYGANFHVKVFFEESGESFEDMGLNHVYARGAGMPKLKVETLKSLEQYGVDLGSLDAGGRSMLHYAALSGSLTTETLAFLCGEAVGLSVDSVDAHGKTALDYAMEEAQKSRHPHTYDGERWSRTERLLSDYQTSTVQAQEDGVTGQ